jgi:hypothetical protein
VEALEAGEQLKARGRLRVITLTHPYINDPKYWHERAEELRSIAKLTDDTDAKRQMRAIAASYDRLANHMQKRSNENKVMKRTRRQP